LNTLEALPFPLVYRDENFFAIDKPAGFFVHPPETSKYPTPKEKVCLFHLHRAFGRPVFPVHRLDAPTSGLVLFALDKHATRELSRLFQDREMEKSYRAVVRGHTPIQGTITRPLKIKGFLELNECETSFKTLAQIELPEAVGTRYSTARYSLVEVQPRTGRWHQIRRHFDQISHPLIGDIEHGDSHHNRFFRDQLRISGLCLRAERLSFTDPFRREPLTLTAPPDPKWIHISQLFQT
jgi:tRNA pseudouridine65 synthase